MTASTTSRRLLALGASGVAVAIGAIALVLATAPSEDRVLIALARGAMTATPIAVGLLVLARRPGDRFAQTLVLAGAVFSLTILAESGNPTLYSVGRVTAWVVELGVVYLLLAFPSGRLTATVDRLMLAATALILVLLYLLPSLVSQDFPVPSPWATCNADCPHNVFALGDTTPAVVEDVIRPLRETLTAIVFLGVAVILAARSRNASPLLRRVLVPVLATAVLRAVAVATYQIGRRAGTVSTALDVLGWLYVLSLVLIAVSFAWGLLTRGLYAAGALQRLTLRLRPETTAAELRSALADALEDPTLELVHRVPGEAGWVDATSDPALPPDPRPGRTVTMVGADDRRTVAIVADASLAQDPALLRAAASYALMILEAGWLRHSLSSSVTELSASRARVVAVADRARRRIERDVHDGAQQRLVALRMKLALERERVEPRFPEAAAELERIGADVEETIDEVRAIAHGIYPSLLADRGLVEALRAAARNAPLTCTIDADGVARLPTEIESAVYFACTTALDDAVARARGDATVSITLRAGDRLRFEVRDDGRAVRRESSAAAGPGDWLGAVGGELAIEVAPGTGTLMRGSVPLG